MEITEKDRLDSVVKARKTLREANARMVEIADQFEALEEARKKAHEAQQEAYANYRKVVDLYADGEIDRCS